MNLVKRLAEPVTESTETIWAPNFDHAAKDPRENAIAVERHNRIVVLEGNCKFFSISGPFSLRRSGAQGRFSLPESYFLMPTHSLPYFFFSLFPHLLLLLLDILNLQNDTNPSQDTLLNIPPWSQISPLSSLTILATATREVARRRLAARHLRAGIVDTLEAGDRRAVENDLPNGDEILANVVPGVDVVFESVDEEGWGS